MKSLYQRLKDAGAEIDNHYSDLYVKKTPKVDEIIKQAKIDGVVHSTGSPFRNNVDGKTWIDIPFQFDPYWEKKGAIQGSK